MVFCLLFHWKLNAVNVLGLLRFSAVCDNVADTVYIFCILSLFHLWGCNDDGIYLQRILGIIKPSAYNLRLTFLLLNPASFIHFVYFLRVILFSSNFYNCCQPSMSCLLFHLSWLGVVIESLPRWIPVHLPPHISIGIHSCIVS